MFESETEMRSTEGGGRNGEIQKHFEMSPHSHYLTAKQICTTQFSVSLLNCTVHSNIQYITKALTETPQLYTVVPFVC